MSVEGVEDEKKIERGVERKNPTQLLLARRRRRLFFFNASPFFPARFLAVTSSRRPLFSTEGKIVDLSERHPLRTEALGETRGREET